MEYFLTVPLGYFVGGMFAGVILSSIGWDNFEEKYNDLKNKKE